MMNDDSQGFVRPKMIRHFLLILVFGAMNAANPAVSQTQESAATQRLWAAIKNDLRYALSSAPSFEADFQITTQIGQNEIVHQGMFVRDASKSTIKSAVLLNAPITLAGLSVYQEMSVSNGQSDAAVILPSDGTVQAVDLTQYDSLLNTGLNAEEIFYPAFLLALVYDPQLLINPVAQVPCPATPSNQCLLLNVQSDSDDNLGATVIHLDLKKRYIVEATYFNLDGVAVKRLQVADQHSESCSKVRRGTACIALPTAYRVLDTRNGVESVIQTLPPRPLSKPLSPQSLLSGY